MTRYYKRQGKLQEYKGNSGNHPRYVQATSGKKTKGYNKNQQEPVSFPPTNKWEKEWFQKSKNDDFGAKYKELKLGSKYSGNPGNPFIFAYPKQSDAKDVLKLRNEENRSVINADVSADDVTDVHFYLLKKPAALDVEIDSSDQNPLNCFYFMAMFKEAL